MERIITSIDQHGRMLVPLSVRTRYNMHPGEKITIEINDDQVIDEMHELFIKKQTNKKNSIVDDFIAKKRQEYLVEEERSNKNV